MLYDVCKYTIIWFATLQHSNFLIVQNQSNKATKNHGVSEFVFKFFNFLSFSYLEVECRTKCGKLQ